MCDPKIRLGIYPMSLVSCKLGVGKQVVLWDSNVHRDIPLLSATRQVSKIFLN